MAVSGDAPDAATVPIPSDPRNCHTPQPHSLDAGPAIVTVPVPGDDATDDHACAPHEFPDVPDAAPATAANVPPAYVGTVPRDCPFSSPATATSRSPTCQVSDPVARLFADEPQEAVSA